MTSPAGPRRPLPPGGAERAITTGRRIRHRRRVATAAGVSALSVVGAGVLLRLSPTGAPSDVLTADDPTPSPSPGGVIPTITPLPVPTVSPSLPDVPDLPGSPDPSPEETAEPSPSPAEPRQYVGHGPREDDGGPLMRRFPLGRDLTFCEQVGQVGQYRPPSGFCAELLGPESFSAGDAKGFRFTMCRQPEAGPATLHFANRAEADFRLNDASWIWHENFAFPPSPRAITFEPGDCMAWVFSWAGQDADGYALPPGDYQLNAILAPTEWTGEDADRMGGPPAWFSVRVE